MACMVFSRRILVENEPDSYSSTTTTGKTHVQNTLETSETHPKQKTHRRPEPRKHTKDLLQLSWYFQLEFFGTMRLFLKTFGLHQRIVTTSILQQNGC